MRLYIAIAAVAALFVIPNIASAGCVAWTTGSSPIAGYPHIKSGNPTYTTIKQDAYYVGANCTGTINNHKYYVGYEWQTYETHGGVTGWYANEYVGHIFDNGQTAPTSLGAGANGWTHYEFTNSLTNHLWRGSELDSDGSANNINGKTFVTLTCGGNNVGNGTYYDFWPFLSAPAPSDIRLAVYVLDEQGTDNSVAYTNNTHIAGGGSPTDCYWASTTPASGIDYPF